MIKKIIYTGLIMLLSVLAVSEAQTAEEITDKADAIFTMNNHLYQKSSMTITRNGKKQPIQIMDSYYMKEEGVSKSLTVFLEPRRVRGTAYLTIGDDLWVKFASTGRIRKMSSSAKKNSAGGSDFSYSDMGEGNDGYGVKYLSVLDGIEKVNSVSCYRIILTPRKNSDDTYEKAVAFISEDDFQYRKIELYEDNAHIKTMTFDNYKVINDKIYPYTLSMESHVRNSISVVDTIDIELDSPKVEERLFSQSYMKSFR